MINLTTGMISLSGGMINLTSGVGIARIKRMRGRVGIRGGPWRISPPPDSGSHVDYPGPTGEINRTHLHQRYIGPETRDLGP